MTWTTPDKEAFYALGPGDRYQEWVWGENPAWIEAIGPQNRWVQISGCGYDCCGETWEVDSMTEEKFAEYLNTFPEAERDYL